MSLILIALGLMLIFEGIPCFGFPEQLKELARKLPELENNTLKWIGLIMMLIGLLLVTIGKAGMSNG